MQLAPRSTDRGNPTHSEDTHALRLSARFHRRSSWELFAGSFLIDTQPTNVCKLYTTDYFVVSELALLLHGIRAIFCRRFLEIALRSYKKKARAVVADCHSVSRTPVSCASVALFVRLAPVASLSIVLSLSRAAIAMGALREASVR